MTQGQELGEGQCFRGYSGQTSGFQTQIFFVFYKSYKDQVCPQMAVYLVWFKTVMISWSSPLIHASLTILPTILAVPITKKNGHLSARGSVL